MRKPNRSHWFALLTALGALFFGARAVQAQSNVYVSFGSSWRYQDNGQPCVDNWPRTNFNDSAWPSGPGRLGFGGDGEQTGLQAGHITYYFRRSFNASNVSASSNLLVRFKRDDGVIIYINGSEVFRNNMPKTNVDYLTLASSAVSNAEETNVFLSSFITGSLLVNGTNVVAAEVHQASANDADLGFDLELCDASFPAQGSLTVTCPQGYSFIGNPVVQSNSTLNGLLPNVVDGTEFWKWNFATQNYDVSTFDGLSLEWIPNRTFANGEGAVIHSPASQFLTFNYATPIQEPPVAVSRPLPPGLRLVGCRTPAAAPFEEVMGFPPAPGDQLKFFDVNLGSVPSVPAREFIFSNSVWYPSQPPLIQPGVGVFVNLSLLPPVIITPPTNRNVSAGTTVSFSVTATSGETPTYQWYKDGVPIAGATGATLTLSNVQCAAMGSYTVRVSNSAGSALSAPGALTVNGCCIVVYCPTNVTVNCASPTGAVVHFTVSATNLCYPDPVSISCSPAPDTFFSVGETPVHCVFTSQVAAGVYQTNFCDFTVTVRTNCPLANCLVLNCPTGIVAKCTGPDGAIVNFPKNATNICTGTPATMVCTPDSGTRFRIGTTYVYCRATNLIDGNLVIATCEFPVTVVGNCTPDPLEACFTPSDLGIGTKPNPWDTNGFRFERFLIGGLPTANNEVIDWDETYAGLVFDARLDVELSTTCPWVTLELLGDGSPVEVQAKDEAGTIVATVIWSGGLLGAPPAPVEVHTLGRPIKRLQLTALSGAAALYRICCHPIQFNDVTHDGGCWKFADGPFGPAENPWTTDGLILTARRTDGSLEGAGHIDPGDPATPPVFPNEAYSGYHIQYEAELRFITPCRSVTLEIYDQSGLVNLVAYDDLDNPIAPQTVGSTGTPISLEFASSGNLIRRLVITSPNGRCKLRRVCVVEGQDRDCARFTGLSGLHPNPFTQDGLQFESFDTGGGLPLAFSVVCSLGGEEGLQVGARTEITMPAPCERMELAFRGPPSPLTIEAFNSVGTRVDLQTVTLALDPATVVTLSGGIKRILLPRADTNAILTRICCVGGTASPSLSAGPVTPVANIDLSVSQAGGLIISNVSPEIPGGLALSFGNETGLVARFDGDLPPSLMPAGGTFRVVLRGLNSEPVGGLAGVKRAGAFLAIPSWPMFISSTYGACLYASNQMICAISNQSLPFQLGALPASFSAQSDNFGQIHLTLDFDLATPISLPGEQPMLGTRLDLVTERSVFAPLKLTRMDLLWTGPAPRTLLPTAGNCLAISIRNTNLIVTCAGSDGDQVHYTVTATNTCTHSAAPVSCSPPSGSRFPLGNSTVVCLAGTVSDRIFRSFQVSVTSDGGGSMIVNPDFEMVTPAPPPGGTLFFGGNVPGWSSTTSDAQIFGTVAGGFQACGGTNYAGLRADTVGNKFFGGVIQGTLTHPVAQGGLLKFMACVSLQRGSGAWVEFVLSDGNPAHEQVITREFVTRLGVWQPLTRNVTYGVLPPEVPAVRFRAAYSHDRIFVRTVQTNEFVGSDGYVLVDDLRMGCFQGMLPGSTAPHTMSLHWVGDGVLQRSSDIGPNAKWSNANVPISHDGNVHDATVPTDGNQPKGFFRLEFPPNGQW